nr:hypothetical protein BSM_04160 [uncultured archaeon]
MHITFAVGKVEKVQKVSTHQQTPAFGFWTSGFIHETFYLESSSFKEAGKKINERGYTTKEGWRILLEL